MSFYSIPVKEWVRSARVVTGADVWESFEPKQMNAPGDVQASREECRPDPAKTEKLESEMPQPDIERAEKEAYQRGLQDGRKIGYEEGFKEAESRLAPHIELFSNLVAALQQEKENFYQENELYIVKLAIEIARKILTREMTQNPELMLYIVREALKRITHTGRIVIRAHPQDIQLVKKDKSILQNHLVVFEQVDFVPDEEMPRGGCTIESESGLVDAGLDVQLEQIERSLLEGVDA